ncbi:uncharacterized protein LOC107430096 [Ziziphus jujuba]|uniref:Uncharacterized protein LOC107430096 n=1 Tax=Ziziphus jujuba TaxID=326968 RepID=A0A6P4AK82_ZIZJJ|nr:uncharacterized protein LOC107430096 [Ziziphus jujuba]XP_048320627.2 uncharacterized protein LOC107430096 [Ziziphus jujuba]
MEQFRHIGEVLGSLKALMVLQDDIQINQSQCRLLLDIFSMAFDSIAGEIKQNLKLEEKNSKWKALEQPLRDLHRVFKEVELYIRQCMDSRDWWGKAISLHQNKDSIEFHIHNLLSHFPAVIEAIETAGEISGLDQVEMEKRRVMLVKKYDKIWNDPVLFEWRFGKQYLVHKEVCNRFEGAWREDRWRLIEALKEKRSLGSNSLTKNELRLVDMLLIKLNGPDSSRGKLFPSSILLGGKDYQVRRRLEGGGQYKEIQWLGESFVLRHFYGEVETLTSEISTLLSLSHPNILQYLCGFCDEDKKECFLVMELMNKDMSTYMKENCGPRRRVLLPLPVVVDLMLQIARGMEYLHSQKIYHGELNPCNILLKMRNSSEGYFQAKISGFGLSSITDSSSSRNSSAQNSVHPFIWHAPEVLAEQEQLGSTSSLKYTEKADVYSFGMLCFELLTGKVPFEDGHLQGDKMSRNIRAGERPLFPFPSPKYLVNLTKRCWQTDPSHRLSFSSICRILRYIKKFLAMNPDQGLPQLQSPPLDYCDIEAGFLKKISVEGGRSSMNSVSQIPYQMFSYRLLEKEKTCSDIKDNNCEAASDAGYICKDAASLCKEDSASVCKDENVSVVEDPIVPPSDTRSVFSDVRSICSETPVKYVKKIPTKKKSPEVNVKKGTGTPRIRAPRPSPLNPCGRSSKINRDTHSPLVTTPLRQNRRTRGHVSDSELH